ncbi:SRPBCC domain-containing protein [Nocardioides caricicola]|uniref:SRPBCC domain-containing protein n=1 Tax=Nocardioides caricicola TaxID=634770 RepID=A0ABW0N180_9ACTN
MTQSRTESREHGPIVRDIQVDASPEVVFEVVSKPEHVREWWPDDAGFESVAGALGELVWRNTETGETTTVLMSVVEVDAPRRFSFRWCFQGEDRDRDSLLVTFDLTPSAGGTLLRMTETGWREMGWEVAVLEEHYQDHVDGWNHYIPRLGEYVARLVATP